MPWYLLEMVDTNTAPHTRRTMVRRFTSDNVVTAFMDSICGGREVANGSMRASARRLPGGQDRPVPAWTADPPLWTSPPPSVNPNPLAHRRGPAIRVGAWRVRSNGAPYHGHRFDQYFSARIDTASDGQTRVYCSRCSRSCSLRYLVRGVTRG